MDRLVQLPGVVQVLGRGDTKVSVLVGAGGVVMQADLRVVNEAQFPFALNYFIGSKDDNIEMRRRAQVRGLKLNEYELAGPDGPVPCRDEAALYRIFGLSYIPPELREHTGEFEAAAKRRPSRPHRNSRYHRRLSLPHDRKRRRRHAGRHGERGQGARLKVPRLGGPFAIADRGQRPYAERVRRQQDAIDDLNKRLKGIHLFKGTECDILADGRLDYDDDLLATFDYVVASVHSHFNQSREEMTERIIKAIRHPAVTMLGHATGRLLLRREGYPVDLEAVLQAAAEAEVMVEINAHPARLDLDWIHCKRAKALGVQLVINPDAHNTADLGLYRFGVDVARRGWLTKADVFNTRPVKEIARALKNRRR